MKENIFFSICNIVITALVANPLTIIYMYRIVTFLTKNLIKEEALRKKYSLFLSLAMELIIMIIGITICWITNPCGEVFNIIVETLYIAFIIFFIIPVWTIGYFYSNG